VEILKNTYKTKAREVLITYLKSHTEKRFTAKEIYDAICKEETGMDRTTLYRNLDRLYESGVLLKFKEPNQDACFYQYCIEHEHCNEHMHGQCSVCGKIFHLEKPFVNEFTDKMFKEYGFDIDPSKTIILGICSDCRHIKKK